MNPIASSETAVARRATALKVRGMAISKKLWGSSASAV
jgi:hypothetical protein